MPLYHYKLNRNGKEVEGDVRAEDRRHVYDSVLTPGDIVVSVEEASGKGGGKKFSFSMDKINQRLSRVKMMDKVLFAKNLSAMIESGLAISRALSVIKRQSKNPAFKAVVDRIEEDISKGRAFFEALEAQSGIFPPVFIAMVRAGEESGKLVEALKNLGEQMERSHKLKKKIKGAMTYPGVIVTAMIGIGILMMIYVVPSLTATFRDLDVELPASTKMIIFTSDLFVNNKLLVLAAIAGIVVGFVALLRTKQGKRVFNKVLLYVPVISGLVKESNSAITARTLSSLLSSGVEVTQALDITKGVIQHDSFRVVLTEAAESVQKGGSLSEAFMKHENLYPIFLSEMIAVGEETGKLSMMLGNVAKYYEEDVEQKTKDLSTIIEPVLMIVVGAAVGFFAVSMITPMYSLANDI